MHGHEHIDTHSHSHEHEHSHEHSHGHTDSAVTEAVRPTEPSKAVVLDVGEHAGALILRAPSQREGLEVEIHPVSAPEKRTHVWVLPRLGRGSTVYAAVFPSLPPDDYAVLEPDGAISSTVAVHANQVTHAAWGV